MSTMTQLLLGAVGRREVTCGPDGYRLHRKTVDDQARTELNRLVEEGLAELLPSSAAVVPLGLTGAGEAAAASAGVPA